MAKKHKAKRSKFRGNEASPTARVKLSHNEMRSLLSRGAIGGTPDEAIRNLTASEPLPHLALPNDMEQRANNIFDARNYFKRPATDTENLINEDGVRLLRQHKMLQRHHFLPIITKAASDQKQLDPLSKLATVVPELVNLAQWFNFGKVSPALIEAEAYRSVDLVGTGMIRLPYPVCVFTHAYMDPLAPDCYIQSFHLVVDNMDKHDDIRIQDMPAGMFWITEFTMVYAPGKGIYFDPRMTCMTDFSRNAAGRYEVISFTNTRQLTGNDLIDEQRRVCDPVAVMVLALNTKNQKMRQVIPDEKLNKARAKQGKPAITPYTYVYMGEYLDAAKETRLMEATGTHASPRPHLRRGHFRYKDHPTLRRWIQPCIVNAHKGTSIERQEYRVKL